MTFKIKNPYKDKFLNQATHIQSLKITTISTEMYKTKLKLKRTVSYTVLFNSKIHFHILSNYDLY